MFASFGSGCSISSESALLHHVFQESFPSFFPLLRLPAFPSLDTTSPCPPCFSLLNSSSFSSRPVSLAYASKVLVYESGHLARAWIFMFVSAKRRVQGPIECLSGTACAWPKQRLVQRGGWGGRWGCCSSQLWQRKAARKHTPRWPQGGLDLIRSWLNWACLFSSTQISMRWSVQNSEIKTGSGNVD